HEHCYSNPRVYFRELAVFRRGLCSRNSGGCETVRFVSVSRKFKMKISAGILVLSLVIFISHASATPISQQAYLKASNTGAGDNFGNVVAISGDTIVVGADSE